MSHPTAAEIHDHVYGFKACPHVENCPECRGAAEALEAERDALKSALAADALEPPHELVVKLSIPRRKLTSPAAATGISLASLAAAALFLSLLVWLLFRGPGTTTPPFAADSGRMGRKDPVDRLITELKGPSPLRREIAAQALKAYGGAVVERLEKANADAALVEACREIPARVPLRILAASSADRWAAALESPVKEKHDEAAEVLRDLGFSAEPALWKLLDSPDAGARTRSAEILKRLYTQDPPPQDGSLESRLRTTRLTLELQETPILDAITFVSGTTGINFAVDLKATGDTTVTIKAEDLSLDNALRLLLSLVNLDFATAKELVLISRPGSVLSTPHGPTWMPPEETRRMEHLMDAISSPDEARHRKAAEELAALGKQALGPLAEGYRLFHPEASARCRAVRRRIAGRLGAWLVDEPSGADVQRLTAAQKDLLNRTVDLQPPGRSLEETLKGLGIPFEMKAPSPPKMAFVAKDLRIAWLLRALTRPHGLDFHLQGDKVVIDTADRVRETVEK